MQTITVGSITYAQKAKRAIAAAGIHVRIVKVEARDEGCVYGLEVPSERHLEAVAILSRLGLYRGAL